jgi:hypothetical protein
VRTHEWVAAVITSPGYPGVKYGEPRAKLADGREMPMGWNAGKQYPRGTKGRARYESHPHASLWRFTPVPDLNLDPIVGGKLAMSFEVRDEKIIARLLLPTREYREQTIWQVGFKPFASTWRSTAARRMAKAGSQHWDQVTPLTLIPSALKAES